MSAEPLPVRRVVKPRKANPSVLPIIAVTRQSIILERTGETLPIAELPQVIVAEESSIIVGHEMGQHLLALHEAFSKSKTFQFRLTPKYRDTNLHLDRSRARVRDTTVSLLGFPGHLHHPVDPLTFIKLHINEIDKGEDDQIIKLLRWGRALRQFCIDNGLKIKPSAGGLASQLLRDPRFYPEPRRKAPGLINKKVREKLPGNYYKLHGKTNKHYSASYIDMQNSHHEIARRVQFPCVNTLRAYGCFNTEKPTEWAKVGSKRLQEALKKPGLFYVRLMVPRVHKDKFPPPCMEIPGEQRVWIYSNELSMIEKLGGRVEAIYCAIISRDVETGLSRYAEFAIEQLEKKPDQKTWLKPVLHSVYGTLAVKAKTIEFGWRVAKGGEEGLYPIGNKTVPVKVTKTRFPIEARTVNVIHRGMIEAEQRKMALELAEELAKKGGEIICIYADSLFVKMPQLPLLSSPWRLKEQVTSLKFLSATQFMSPQITRLPGVPRELQDRFAAAGLGRFFRPGRRVDCPRQSPNRAQAQRRNQTNGRNKDTHTDNPGQGVRTPGDEQAASRSEKCQQAQPARP